MEKIIGLKPSTNNALGLHDPASYLCRVWKYAVSHSCLLIRAGKIGSHPPKTFYLLFEGVSHFLGPLSWKGADLRVATTEELIDFAKSYNISFGPGTLCIFETPEVSVKLLTTNFVTMMSEPPEIMRFQNEGDYGFDGPAFTDADAEGNSAV